MAPPDPDTPLIDLLADWETHPAQARLLRRLGLDAQETAGQTLAEACEQEGLDPHTVGRILDTADDGSGAEPSAEWLSVSLTDLIDHIQSTHHDYLRRELPRLSQLLDEGAPTAEDGGNEWWARLREGFRALKSDLRAQLQSEDEYIFPALRTVAEGRVLPDGSTPTSELLRRMEAGHDRIKDGVERLRARTEHYRPPPEAGAPLREAMGRLQALEEDLRRHIYEETMILLPRIRSLV